MSAVTLNNARGVGALPCRTGVKARGPVPHPGAGTASRPDRPHLPKDGQMQPPPPRRLSRRTLVTATAAGLVAAVAAPSRASSAAPTRFHTVGRVKAAADGFVRYSWPGIYFEGRFRGTGVGIVLDDSVNDYDVQVDGRTVATLVTPGRTTAWVKGLTDTRAPRAARQAHRKPVGRGPVRRLRRRSGRRDPRQAAAPGAGRSSSSATPTPPATATSPAPATVRATAESTGTPTPTSASAPSPPDASAPTTRSTPSPAAAWSATTTAAAPAPTSAPTTTGPC